MLMNWLRDYGIERRVSSPSLEIKEGFGILVPEGALKNEYRMLVGMSGKRNLRSRQCA